MLYMFKAEQTFLWILQIAQIPCGFFINLGSFISLVGTKFKGTFCDLEERRCYCDAASGLLENSLKYGGDLLCPRVMHLWEM